MGQLYRAIAVICAAVQLASCAGTAALEPQTSQRDARTARLYFLREKGILGSLGGSAAATEIKVDGKVVGTLRNGSYIYVDRPPGVHQLSVSTSLSMAFETDTQVDAGREYYFNIGPPSTGAPGTDLLNHGAMGGTGQQMRANSPLSVGFSGAAFFSIDAATGAAEIAGLKAP